MTSDERNKTSSGIASRLRSLQGDGAAPYGWQEFKRRSLQKQGTQWHRTAIAASLVLALAAVAGWMRYSAGDGLGQVDSASFDGPVFSVVGQDGHDSLEAATSQWLADLPTEPAIVRVGNRLPVVELEDRIAWIDDLLNTVQVESAQPVHIQTLQRERAQLISSLARVRYAETLAAER